MNSTLYLKDVPLITIHRKELSMARSELEIQSCIYTQYILRLHMTHHQYTQKFQMNLTLVFRDGS